MIRNNRGITLMAMVVTVVLLLIISGAAVYSIRTSPDTNKLNKMVNDISILREKVLIYYNKYGEAPIIGSPIADIKINRMLQETKDPSHAYYKIDIAKLENLTLNYGNDNSDEDDIYVINNSTLKIYYLKGINYKGEMEYTVND